MAKKDKGKSKEKPQKSEEQKAPLVRKIVDSKNRVFYLVTNVRCYWPDLFGVPTIDGEKGRAGTKLALSKEDPREKQILKELNKIIDETITLENEGNPLSPDKYFVRDGAFANTPMPDFWHVSMHCKAGTFPKVLDRTGKNIISNPAECNIYSGCRVNLKFRTWWQDDKTYGKRVNGSLVSIQFAGDDDPFDPNAVTAEEASEGFEAVEVGSGEEFVG